MKQYVIDKKTIRLKVKKSPLLVRGVMFSLSFFSFTLPLVGIITRIAMGKGFHMGSFIFLFLFGLIGFYLLRTSLWNTYGEETIKLLKSRIEYEANYGWFKDGKKSINLNGLVLSIEQVGYQEDNTGVLIFEGEEAQIESVVKMPINQLEHLIEEIKPIIENLQ
ncbi:hypothetical protein [Mesonia sp. K7]|uniref:hypothetical protein n=1 Tax=Mesonia sp. K7 TaxID=2218606 RepID=UPI000DB80A59|nr:hypothetical protein [Mesonia sp. K7]PZD79515.1 hypothetical protein DNG35_00465 [Mesonia sp. K7]